MSSRDSRSGSSSHKSIPSQNRNLVERENLSTPPRRRRSQSPDGLRDRLRRESWTPRTTPRRRMKEEDGDFPKISRVNEKKNEGPKNIYDWLSQGIVMAGGATGKYLVVPPIQILKRIIWEISTPYLRAWFKVLEESFSKAWKIISNTPVGKRWTDQLLRFWLEDIGDVATHASTRQLLIDGMATSVKFAEALDTPETRVLFQQLAVLGCRITDAISSGATKQMIHDGFDLLWDTVDVWSDPATTLALAEVVATICHALESDRQYGDPKDRRQRRDAHQARTYTDPYTIYDPNVSVEEAILSSLSGGCGRAESQTDADSTLESRKESASSINEDEDSQVPKSVILVEKEQVDGEYLKESIVQRAASLKDTRKQHKASEDENSKCEEEDDVEDLNVSPPKQPASSIPPQPHKRREGETASAHFYRILDDALVRQRESSDSWHPRAAAAAGAGNEYGQDIGKRYQRSSRIGVSDSTFQMKRTLEDILLPNKSKKWSRRYVLCAIGAVSFLSMTWTILGLYGMYTLVIGTSPMVVEKHRSPSSESSEIVIRVVRQVVHVRDDNRIVDDGDVAQIDSILSTEESNAIAECVAKKL